MSWSERLAGVVTDHSRLVIVCFLLLTVLVGAGGAQLEERASFGSSDSNSTVQNAQEYTHTNFGERSANTTTVQIVVRNDEGNVLSKESLLRSLRLQQELRTDDRINQTLVADRPTVGVATLVSMKAMATDSSERRHPSAADVAAATPPLAEQIAQLESMSPAEVAAVVSQTLDGRGPAGRAALALLPADYEPGSTSADARLLVVTQRTEQPTLGSGGLSEDVVSAQLATRAVATERDDPESYHVVSSGLVWAQEEAASADSMSLSFPLLLILVLGTLGLAYRDPLDIALALVGLFLTVAIWTFGLMGWFGVPFSPLMTTLPILLVALSIDYALHVVMRYREEHDGTRAGMRSAMQRGLAGVGLALVLVTATTAIGFLGNLTSQLVDVRQLGVATALGIVSALFVFGLFLPAVKLELDRALADRGFSRTRSAVGTAGGRVGRILSIGPALARRWPRAVILVAVVTSLVGGAAGTTIQPAYDERSFLANDPPEWTAELPGPLALDDYPLREDVSYLYDTFRSPDREVTLLVRGNVTDPATLASFAESERRISSAGLAAPAPGNGSDVQDPLTVMHALAERNETFARSLAAADTDDDGVPDRNVSALYAQMFALAPAEASAVIHRENGQYVAVRQRFTAGGDEDPRSVATAMRSIATDAEDEERSAVATGRLVARADVMERLMSTVLTGLAVTLVAVLLLLLLAYRLTAGAATLGALTIVPVLMSVGWLLGTMALLDVPFTMTSVLIGGLTVGIGVDYAIHVTRRYTDERAGGAAVLPALSTTVTTTGGALLGSAATTALGFSTLGLSLLPSVRMLGGLSALSIAFAYLASVLVLPSLLVLYERTTLVSRAE